MPRHRIFLLALLILGHLVLDLFVPQCLMQANRDGLIRNALAAITIGVCVSQIDLIALWATLATGPVAVRLPWSLFLGALMWNALIAGNQWERFRRWSGSFSATDAIVLGVCIAVGLLGVLFTLWIARRFFSWRLGTQAALAATAAERKTQFSIAQLMLGTALLSLTLGVSRVIMPPFENDFWPPLRELPVIVGAMSIVNLVTVLPCVWGAFTPPARWPLMCLGWTVYALVITSIEIFVFCAVLGTPPELTKIFFVFCLINLAQCASVFLTFILLRTVGFQLVREGRTPLPEPPLVAATVAAALGDMPPPVNEAHRAPPSPSTTDLDSRASPP